MSKVKPCRLVIDASVAGAAGSLKKITPASKPCRDFLLTVLEVCHRVVMTTEIGAEWKRHAGPFARIWLVRMYARRKVERITSTRTNLLKDRFSYAPGPESMRNGLRKDSHLISAALETDGRLVSLDEKLRSNLQKLAHSLPELKRLTFVNPLNELETPLDWLQQGAPPRPFYNAL